MKELTKSNYGKQITTLQALMKLADKAKKVIYKDKIYSARFLLNTFKHSNDERIKDACIYKYKDKSHSIERPKYFIVERDSNNPLWWEYIKWLNNTYGTLWMGAGYRYYGYEGNSVFEGGTNASDYISDFKNNPVLLTLEEWHRLFIENGKKVKKKPVREEQSKKTELTISKARELYQRFPTLRNDEILKDFTDEELGVYQVPTLEEAVQNKDLVRINYSWLYPKDPRVQSSIKSLANIHIILEHMGEDGKVDWDDHRQKKYAFVYRQSTDAFDIIKAHTRALIAFKRVSIAQAFLDKHENLIRCLLMID